MIHIMIYTVTAGDFFEEVDRMLIGDKARGLGGADEDTLCLLAGEDDGAGSICLFDGWILTSASARFFSSFSCKM